MKKHLYTVFSALCAVAALAFLILCVVTLIPVGMEGLRVAEPIKVSASPLDAEGGKYLVQVRGSLINETDTPVELEKITLKISDGRSAKDVVLPAATLQPRLALELTDSWEDGVAYTYVDAVFVTVQGRQGRVENTEQSILGADTVVTLAVAALFALVALALGKQRYYIYQEEKMASH